MEGGEAERLQAGTGVPGVLTPLPSLGQITEGWKVKVDEQGVGHHRRESQDMWLQCFLALPLPALLVKYGCPP